MKTYLTAYTATLVAFVAIDFVWLNTMADRLYRPTLDDMLAPQFRLVPAVAFYLIYAAGLTFLAVRTGLVAGSIATAAIYGAAIGFMAYATYDLTNQSTLKNWSTMLTVADLIWGTVLSAVASGAGFWVTQRIFGAVARL
ncbi:putative membrane protein [Rhizobium leguminosarum]|uniref:Putative membrane protein n=1 Tax=Rhizobium leguminosarum TaxID=384 RepID=A0A7Z0E1G9_RHILE|nr:DUF2177 family protein [Rhizobium leguminosarum]MBB5661851.1 putative membrane protein [Rhizobium leguminosarum]NYJ13323.1 putative membrane protein [Rhizobium leguminosarum]